jgi:hypothetical protein
LRNCGNPETIALVFDRFSDGDHKSCDQRTKRPTTCLTVSPWTTIEKMTTA